MQFPCRIEQLDPQTWRVRHQSREIGSLEVTAPNRAQALEKMRSELQYRLEWCPCTGELYRDAAIEIIETPD